MRDQPKKATPATLTFWRRTAMVCAIFVVLSTFATGLMVAGISERTTLSLVAVMAMLSPLLILEPQTSDSEPARWQPAALVVTAGLAIMITTGLLVSSYWTSESAGTTYGTTNNESRTHQLEDGTVIALGAESKLRVKFTANRRVVQLISGEVRFDVAKDPTRPFIVTTFLANLENGTKFRVLVDSQVKVIVDEGIVRIHSRGASSGAAIEVKAGSSYRIFNEEFAGLAAIDTSDMYERGAS